MFAVSNRLTRISHRIFGGYGGLYDAQRVATRPPVQNNVSLDWTLRENVCVQLRVLVKRMLGKYGYSPDKQAEATQTGLEQVALLFVE